MKIQQIRNNKNLTTFNANQKGIKRLTVEAAKIGKEIEFKIINTEEGLSFNQIDPDYKGLAELYIKRAKILQHKKSGNNVRHANKH